MEGVDVVFHLAAIRITQCAEDPRLALHVLADGTFNVIEAAVAAGVARTILSSSASVYGLATQFPTPETQHPYDNRTMYGAAKLFNEGVARSYHDTHGFDYVALRYFNVYGPRMDTFGAYTEVLVRWMERIDAGLPPQIFGDGEQTMDFIYVEDVARANLLAALAVDVTDQSINIGTGVETSLNDLAQRLLRTMGSSVGVEYGEARRVNPVPRRLADVSKAKALIKFDASVSLDEGLARLVEWWRRERQTHAPAQA
jgi:UDP-glucose 4-epimerase